MARAPSLERATPARLLDHSHIGEQIGDIVHPPLDEGKGEKGEGGAAATRPHSRTKTSWASPRSRAAGVMIVRLWM